MNRIGTIRNTRLRRWLAASLLAVCAAFAAGLWYALQPHPVTLDTRPCWQPSRLDSAAPLVSQQRRESKSRFLPVHGSIEALAWRLALIDAAERSIDAQYFIWQMDEVGELFLERSLQAADRGVKVRLLLDDLTGGLDEKWIVAKSHPNVDIRLFNRERECLLWLAKGLRTARISYRLGIPTSQR